MKDENENIQSTWTGSPGVMRFLGITMPTLRRYMKAGLPYYQNQGERGRLMFDLQEVDLWVRANFERFPKEK